MGVIIVRLVAEEVGAMVGVITMVGVAAALVTITSQTGGTDLCLVN